MLNANTLAYSMLSNSRFDGVNVLRYGIAVITRIIQSEMADLLIQGMDLMTQTPLQYVLFTVHTKCSFIQCEAGLGNGQIWGQFTKIITNYHNGIKPSKSYQIYLTSFHTSRNHF